MVYHYTNFIVETNTWWLRRVRPVWMTLVGGWIFWVGYRYYFFGKNQARWQKHHSEEEWIRRAQLNKREWGYNQHYQPTLERSYKKVLYADPNYKFPVEWENRYVSEPRSVARILQEENEEWEYYK